MSSIYSISTVDPTLTSDESPASITVTCSIKYSSSLILASTILCFSLAAWYSAFSDKSPCALASFISATTSRLTTVVKFSNSFFKSLSPS